MAAKPQVNINEEYEKLYGFHMPERSVFKAEAGLDEEKVKQISGMKEEPSWMLDFRLRGYRHYNAKPMPTWANTELLNSIPFDNIYYYLKPTEKKSENWDDVPSEIKETFDRLGIPEAERKFLAGVSAQYECLAGDTRVLANPSATLIKDIQAGSYVYSLNEQTKRLEKQRVKCLMPKGERPVFKVVVAGRTIKATANHPLLALTRTYLPGRQRGRFGVQWTYLSNLKVGDYVALAKELPDEGKPYVLPPVPFSSDYEGRNQLGSFHVTTSRLLTRRQPGLRIPTQTTEALAWFLGLFLGDGYIGRGSRKEPKDIVSIAIPASDEATRERLQTVVKDVFGYVVTFGKERYRVRIHSRPIVEFLDKLGLDLHAHTKRLPVWAFGLPKSQKLGLLGGFIDADGYVRKTKVNNDVSMTSCNYALLNDLHLLAVTCGFRVSQIHTFKSSMTYKGQTKTRLGYRMYLYGDLAPLKPYSVRCTKDVVARRWYQRYTGAFGSPINAHTSEHLGFAKIESIHPAGVESVYDIEVEGYHNFIAEGLIVHNSESVYHSMREDLQKQGVIFLDMDTALKEQPEIVKRYFGTVIPPADNKFAALNTAVWSGGSFIYVPKGVKVAMPLQAYFRINAKNMGQFERTLIIADEGAEVTYIEGCFTKGALVTTNPDYKPIEQIKVGERVLTHKGKYRHVYHTQERPYSGPLYTIEVYGDSTQRLEVTEEHPFLYVSRERRNERNRHWDVRWGTPKDLQHLDYLAVPINRIVESVKSFSVKVLFRRQEEEVRIPSTPAFFRLAGYFLAEGSTDPRGYIHFAFGETERDFINDVKRLMQETFGITKVDEFPYRRNHGISLVVSSARLARAFRQLFGESAATRRIPQWMMLETPEKQRELILGVFRGDGNYYNQPNKHGRKEIFRLSTISPVLARQLRDMLLRLGVVAFLNSRTRRHEGRQTMYTVGIGGEFAVPFGKLVGIRVKPTLNGKKRATMFSIDQRYAYVPIKRITKRTVHNIPVYNFSVEGDESYVAGGVAVHNCTAPVYSSDSLHSAVVELIALPHGKIRYVTIQNWSKNVYNLVTKRAVAHEGATVEWLDGNLGCVRAGELVYTEHGPQPIERVGVGTRVWSFDEANDSWTLRPVVARKASGPQRVYKVVFSNGRAVHLTSNHPLLSIHYDGSRPKKLGRYALRWKPLRELKAGDGVVFPSALPLRGAPYRFVEPQLTERFLGRNQYGASYEVASHARLPLKLPHKADEDACWLLGLWLADGDCSIMHSANGRPRFGRVGWSVPRPDRARKRLMQLIERYTGAHRIEERKDGNYFRINSVEFALWLEANGLRNGSRQKRVPTWAFTLPTNLQLALLAGYLDGDGYARRSELVAKSANPELLSDMQVLATLSGIHTGLLRTQEVQCDFGGTVAPKCYVTHQVAFTGLNQLRRHLSHRLRSRLRPVEKALRYYHLGNRKLAHLLPKGAGITRITAIRSSGVAPTYDLEIEGTSSFVVNGILVHNSKLTMKYPGVYLMGRGARGEVLSVAFAGSGQHQDAGAKMIHAAPDTSSVITSKSISKGAGRTTYRGLVKVYPGAVNAKSTVRCDALLLNEESRSDTYPTMEIDEKRVQIGHEATVSKIGDEQLFYAMSRGLTEAEAMMMIVNGFIEPFVKELPLEYSVELNRLVQLEMEGAVG